MKEFLKEYLWIYWISCCLTVITPGNIISWFFWFKILLIIIPLILLVEWYVLGKNPPCKSYSN